MLHTEPIVKVIRDSIYNGSRLTTLELEFWRPILPELTRHRCVVGSTMLNFDLPSGATKSDYRLYQMSMEEFHDKWVNGCAPRDPTTRQHYDLSLIDPEREYFSFEIADLLGISKTNIHTDCRNGLCKHRRDFSNPSVRAGYIKIFGKDFIEYRQKKEQQQFRYSIRNRLEKMQLRCYDEISGSVSHTNIVNCWCTGIEPVKTLTAGSYQITATNDHLILTNNGWKELQDIVPGFDYVIVQTKKTFTKEEYKERIKKYQYCHDGSSFSHFCRQAKQILIPKQNGHCAFCGCELGSGYNAQVHHIKPRHQHTELDKDINNCVILCNECHKEQHEVQGWQNHYSKANAQWQLVDSIEDAGEQTVYDIEVADEQHNFFANGIVVHNCFSFCFRSSRATNTDIYIDACQNNPWGPRHLTANQKGMVGKEVQLRPHEQEVWEQTWITTARQMTGLARHLKENALSGHGHLSKEITNRILEPYVSAVGLISGTEWSNFFKLRCAPEAQGEMRDLAMAIKHAMYDSEPVELQRGMWHLPYINDEELANNDMQDLVKASAARCARVSRKRFDGTTSIAQDVELCNKLIHNGHMSPLEMVAQASEGLPSNYDKNWLQYRKVIENGIPFGTILSTD